MPDSMTRPPIPLAVTGCLLAIAGCLLAAPALRAQTPATAAPPLRSGGDVNLHLAAGSSNGARLGIWMFTTSHLAMEASFGYVQLKNTNISREGMPDVKADGWSGSFGCNLLTHPQNNISPLLSGLVSFNQAHDKNWNLDMRRVVATVAFGSVWNFSRHFGLFFRTGPSLHFLSKDEESVVQLIMQFDGGFGWTF